MMKLRFSLALLAIFVSFQALAQVNNQPSKGVTPEELNDINKRNAPPVIEFRVNAQDKKEISVESGIQACLSTAPVTAMQLKWKFKVDYEKCCRDPKCLKDLDEKRPPAEEFRIPLPSKKAPKVSRLTQLCLKHYDGDSKDCYDQEFARQFLTGRKLMRMCERRMFMRKIAGFDQCNDPESARRFLEDDDKQVETCKARCSDTDRCQDGAYASTCLETPAEEPKKLEVAVVVPPPPPPKKLPPPEELTFFGFNVGPRAVVGTGANVGGALELTGLFGERTAASIAVGYVHVMNSDISNLNLDINRWYGKGTLQFRITPAWWVGGSYLQLTQFSPDENTVRIPGLALSYHARIARSTHLVLEVDPGYNLVRNGWTPHGPALNATVGIDFDIVSQH